MYPPSFLSIFSFLSFIDAARATVMEERKKKLAEELKVTVEQARQTRNKLAQQRKKQSEAQRQQSPIYSGIEGCLLVTSFMLCYIINTNDRCRSKALC